MQHVEVKLDPEDVILLILEANERVLGRSVLRGITRLEKLVYLLNKETKFTGIASLFIFRPYLYGPYSEEVASAVKFLEGIELIEVETCRFINWATEVDEEMLETADRIKHEYVYSLTENGRKIAKYWIEHLGKKDIEYINQIVQRYGTMPLNQLIRYVYRKYPDTTVNSVHAEAQRLGNSHGG